jgi:hypothetical protein
MVNKVTLGQVYLRVLPCTLVIVMPPLLHTHLQRNSAVISVSLSNAAVPFQILQERCAAFVGLKSETNKLAVSSV